jgi:hypothetical protein
VKYAVIPEVLDQKFSKIIFELLVLDDSSYGNADIDPIRK